MIELPNSLKKLVISKSKYDLKFVQTKDELEGLQRLRYEVFNQELKAGKSTSESLQLDQDEYDEFSFHMAITDNDSGQVVSTARLQDFRTADTNIGFYTSEIFDTTQLPKEIYEKSVEIGRGCTLENHRNIKTFYLIQLGVEYFLQATNNHNLIGCFSLLTQDVDEAYATLVRLKQDGYMHPDCFVDAMPKYKCAASPNFKAEDKNVEIPKLLQFYRAAGTRIASPPALDEEFKTIDLLMLNTNYQQMRAKK